jgi:capsular polysaccharide biosynthesis protein
MNNDEDKSKKNIHDYDEISLKELIVSIWEERKLIIWVTSLILVATIIYTFVIATPIYKAETELLIKKPEPVQTRYGTYSFPSEYINDYIEYLNSNEVVDRVIEKNELNLNEGNVVSNDSFRDKITISKEEESNRFSVAFEYKDPDRAYEINESLVKTYMDTIRIKYKLNAIEQFIYDYEVEIDNIESSIDREEKIMKDTKELLDSITPIYTLQKLLFSDPEAAAAYANEFNLDISDISDNIMTQEYVNKNYFDIESKFLDSKTRLISMRESLERKKIFYEELIEEQKLIEDLRNTENEEEILNGKMDVMRDNIIVLSEAYSPNNPVSPNKLLNLAIGTVLGLMIGIFTGLFRAYWKNSEV